MHGSNWKLSSWGYSLRLLAKVNSHVYVGFYFENGLNCSYKFGYFLKFKGKVNFERIREEIDSELVFKEVDLHYAWIGKELCILSVKIVEAYVYVCMH